MGLLTPTSGCLKLDDSELNFSNLRVWQSKIGLVPQTIFLSDASILENIGFGLPISEIEMGQAMHACKLACLDEFIGSLPNGIYTTVGERGVQLSGGQRQRIGIARALYNNAELLVFDEATSALDGVTERNIMKAINDLSGQRTLIMVAHRLSTVKKCDVIYYMDDGEIVASGSYGELLESNEKFKELDLLS
jgi:HlyD family secretion protein